MAPALRAAAKNCRCDNLLPANCSSPTGPTTFTLWQQQHDEAASIRTTKGLFLISSWSQVYGRHPWRPPSGQRQKIAAVTICSRQIVRVQPGPPLSRFGNTSMTKLPASGRPRDYSSACFFGRRKVRANQGTGANTLLPQTSKDNSTRRLSAVYALVLIVFRDFPGDRSHRRCSAHSRACDVPRRCRERMPAQSRKPVPPGSVPGSVPQCG